MDIKHLEYYITIVENNYNLSKAAEVLHISQPGLTKFIKDFEAREKTELFVRYRGRLVGLTPSGTEFLENAKQVLGDYQHLMGNLRNKSQTVKGTVRVGIPPVILTVLFHDAIPKFISENPDINLQIVEAGAYELQKMLLLQEIDMAFLISPITTPNIVHRPVFKNNVSVIFGDKNSLTKSKKNALKYEDLANHKLVILNDSFMLHHQIMKNFNLAGITPKIVFQSGNWDLLVSMCDSVATLTILPTPIIGYYSHGTLQSKPFEPEFPWTVEVCKLANIYQNNIIEHTENYFRKFMQ